MPQYHPDDRPEAHEQPIRARVPDHVSGGAFSTGVIVMTAQSEFILDFVQNLGRPHQIVSRVVMPHSVLPQLVDALHRNMELYRGRWGDIVQPTPRPVEKGGSGELVTGDPSSGSTTQLEDVQPPSEQQHPLSGDPVAAKPGVPGGSPGAGTPAAGGISDAPTGDAVPPNPPGGNPKSNSGARQASAQEIYDDLKIRDELLSGAYANAVMIGHGPHEFSFDFITNFYPHSAVSARVFLAAGQVPRLYDSLKGTWDQLRSRMQPPPDSGPHA